MSFALDLIFVGLQQLVVGIVTAIFQVPLDVITAWLSDLVTPGG